MVSAAVQVENLSFSYKRHGRNLESVQMLVPRGTIYGLLGPSGCGKTTLLRCIVGRLKPRAGMVSVFGYRPGTEECGIPGPNIGYMPQELSLISQFTVRETLEYYAGFAKPTQTMQSLQSRIEFLLKLLDISEFEHCYTDRLSGGQQRRVSLAVAMINDPPLLILDEPTVGVDPIVRESIWSYLVDQSKNGLTVVVTTHYIEEAGQADRVGFLRQGRLLAEGNPNVLILQHGVSSMERLFLKLSQHDDLRHHHDDYPKEVLLQLENNHKHHNSATIATTTNHQQYQMNLINNEAAAVAMNGSIKSLAALETTASSTVIFANGTASLGGIGGETKKQQLLTSNIAPAAGAEHYRIFDPESLLVEASNNNNNNQASSLVVNNNNNNKIMINNDFNNHHQSAKNNINNDHHYNTSPTTKMRAYSVHGQARSMNSFEKIGVLCRKHRIRLFRRVPELVITILLPALEVALFCLCMGRDPTSVQMAVCNQENPPFLSLLFLKSIDSDFIALKYYKTPEEAIDSVRNADTYSAIVLARNFSNSLRKFSHLAPGVPLNLPKPEFKKLSAATSSFSSASPIIGATSINRVTRATTSSEPLMTPYLAPSSSTQSMKRSTLVTPSSTSKMIDLKRMKRNGTSSLTEPGDFVEEEEDESSIIRIYYDGSNALHVNIIRREVFSALFRFVEVAGKTLGGQVSGYKLPIKFEKPIYGGEKTDMIEFVGPGLMVFIVFFATMSITSMAFLSERREGTLERSIIVGMTPTEFIIAQIINITFLLIVQITLTVVMGFWIFDFPMKGSYILAVTMMFLQGLCGMTFGLMLSAICTSEMTALALGAGSQLMFCFITGIFWPVETMIAMLRYISYAMPQTKPMESFRHILIRGFDLSKPAVLNGYLITVAWIAFFLILAIVIFRVK